VAENARLREALDLVCRWAGINLKKRNTVVSAGIAALLGSGDEERIAAVRDIVARKDRTALRGDREQGEG
jgi:hypothetical protein